MRYGRGLTVIAALMVGFPAGAQFLEPDVEILATHVAEAAGDSFGWVGESIGDLTGDGVAEYVIGAPFSNAGGAASGKVYVYDGATRALVHSIVGDPFDTIGFSVTGGGDFNADGTPDYAFGGPAAAGGGTGRVVMISGADHSVLHDVVAPVRTLLGYDVGLAGDVNGDGRDDLIAGAVLASDAGLAAGQVLLISGADGSVLWRRDGEAAINLMGGAVSGLCDLNGDGIPEQAAGAFRAGPLGTGRAYVLNGADGAILRTLIPNGTAGAFGQFFVHDAGDVNADGVCDIYVGDFGDSRLGPGSGRGYVFSGAADERLRLFNADSAGEGLGIGRGAGDLDGDGFDDLLLGAWINGDAAVQGGQAIVYSGKTGQIRREMTGIVALAQLGFDVAVLGDVNGDSIVDFLITGNDVSHVVAGVALDTSGND